MSGVKWLDDGRWICPACGMICDPQWRVCPACSYMLDAAEEPPLPEEEPQ